ncbi:hypothetical protein HK097_005942 [Rhizophlyctis rosea]|uniref:V-SNARE coiled-coil homology domain-containing protein n=1 Tax=Rhizophlyctis rosea TaxID=64517 RepID=A0AAD5SDT2_9FUNG|nr:hypothetical protein HK097_005942 [Rhizophlyctis rosea]
MASNGPNKTQAVQQQVDEVVGIMQDNINKVMQRGEQLNSLQNKTEDLQNSSMQFRKGASKVRRQMWWKDVKMKLILAAVIGAIIIVIVVTVLQTKKNQSTEQTGAVPTTTLPAAVPTTTVAAAPTTDPGAPAPTTDVPTSVAAVAGLDLVSQTMAPTAIAGAAAAPSPTV